jgi:hypothetical protein
MINNNWLFGTKGGVTFSPSIGLLPPPTNGNLMNTREGCASVSDDNGNLLFYTDGQSIYNTAAVSQPIYKGLKGDISSTQSCIIVPDPRNNSRYYIFTADGNSQQSDNSAHLFNGVRVDVSTWNIEKLEDINDNTISPQYYKSIENLDNTDLSPAEKVTAIPMDDCEGYWIVTILQRSADPKGRIGAGLMRVYKLDISGLVFSHEMDMVPDTGSFFIRDVGSLKASHNSEMIAISNIGVNSKNNRQIIVFPFDMTTGTVDFNQGRPVAGFKDEPYGLEFSPNSDYLYTTTLREGRVFQIDLTVQGALTPFAVSQTEPYLNGHCHGFGALQLGPDEKIYIARPCRGFLGAINKPNEAGAACDVNPEEVVLGSDMTCELGLPNMISTLLCDDETSGGCDCDHDCAGCNEDAEAQNEELIERAKDKHNVIKADDDCADPFLGNCTLSALASNNLDELQPCFYFHWGDGVNDQIEEHDTEVFYLTACNNFNDITFNGLRISKVTLIPNVHPLDKIHIVPDRFINLDCLEPCSCQTREFAMITRGNDTAGDYTLQVEYCYEGISITGSSHKGMAEFPLIITED